MTPPDPGAILAMWASGIAAGVAVVSLWKVARSGFVLLGAGVAALIGVLAVAAGAGVPSWGAIGSVLIAVPLRKTRWAALAIGLAAILWIWPASEPWGLGVASAGALALGGITSEMLLGHWYLVDPKLPRWPLRRLAIVGVVGISIDAIVIRLVGRETGPVPPALLIGLAITTALLMVAVWFSLKGRSYTGVMAATGLSYLATLTALGAVVLGRANVL